jgi:hypothetical protein
VPDRPATGGEHGFVPVLATFIADEETFEREELRKGALEERDQFGAVAAVSAGQRERERRTSAVDQGWVLRPVSAPIDRARLGGPLLACMRLPSTTARDHSISPGAHSRVSNTACSSSHAPACCHSSNLHQHVNPDRRLSS